MGAVVKELMKDYDTNTLITITGFVVNHDTVGFMSVYQQVLSKILPGRSIWTISHKHG